MMFSTCISRRRPSVPPGWRRANSSAEKPRASSTATASASPIASAVVVLVVGARLCGQASCSTLTSSAMSAACASEESIRPVSTINGTPSRLTCGISNRISAVSPELDSASSRSGRVIIPKSPCPASAGCRKKAGVPVLASVAAIFPAMWPDLPMPLTMTRPSQASSARQAAAKCASRRLLSAAMPACSLARVRRAVASRAESSSVLAETLRIGAHDSAPVR